MRAVVIEEAGDADVLALTDVPTPDPGPDEVRVAVRAAAVNHTDVWVRRGIEGTLPRIPGLDVAGVVDAVGEDVPEDRVGERVVLYWNTTFCGECEYCRRGEHSMCLDYGGIGIDTDGGHAEYLTVPARNAVPLPDDVPFETAAAFPSGFGTAWRALLTRGDVSPGDDVLVLGASGGVGHAAVQIADRAGATVYACTSADWKAERLRDLGADETIDYTERAVHDAVADLTGKVGVDVALDSVGGAQYADVVQSLKRDGRLVTVGATTGDADAAMLPHVFWKQLNVVGSTGCTLAEFHDVLDELAAGTLTPVVHDTVGLDGVADAHRDLEDRAVFGKIVVTP